MEKVVSMTYASSITNLCEVNKSFDAGVLRIAYAGENRNGSCISKEAFEKSIKTMYNCPVVCNYDRETDTFGGHDIDVVRDADGELKMINLTTPVGCVPESAKYWWAPVEEEDGTVRDYLFTEVLLWKRQEAYQKIKRDGITAHSMEITVKDGMSKNGVYHIDDFEFTAFTLIGVEPCFESSNLTLFAKQDFKRQMSEMMHELKESIGEVGSAASAADDTQKTNQTMEGGEEVLEENMERSEVEKTEELEEEVVETSEIAEEVDEAANVENEVEHEGFELNRNIEEEVFRAISAVSIDTEWGSMPKYCCVDFDADAKEVYCWDRSDWLLYGFSYSMNRDNVVIDFESKKRMKYAIVEFDNGEQASPFADVFTQMADMIHGNVDLEAKYQIASDKIEALNSELEELKQFKEDTENKERNARIEEVFENFSDLNGVDAFDRLVESHEGMSAEDIEEKCFAICGRMNKTVKFSAVQHPKIMVGETNIEQEPYGGVIAKYTCAEKKN